MSKLLLHTCCGPCLLGVLSDETVNEFEITSLYYNPNIYPEEEYTRRLDNLKEVSQEQSLDLIELEYAPKDHAEAIKGLEEDFPRRCLECYRLRLDRTAKEAINNNYDYFSTTLLVSPYQQHEKLKEIGEEIGEKYNIKFYYKDFRPFFRKGQEKAIELEIYRQKYCGCKWSFKTN